MTPVRHAADHERKVNRVHGICLIGARGRTWVITQSDQPPAAGGGKRAHAVGWGLQKLIRKAELRAGVNLFWTIFTVAIL